MLILKNLINEMNENINVISIILCFYEKTHQKVTFCTHLLIILSKIFKFILPFLLYDWNEKKK